MIERHLHAVRTDAPADESIAATRERLAGAFPRGSTRRMTQLGLLLGGVLSDLATGEEDAIVYASTYAETRALEDYLASFPTPSPTLFQTSIHPSAIQQVLIARQQPVREFFPHTGRDQLVAHALQSAALAAAPRVIVCGGEEHGTWLAEQNAASPHAFAFAFALSVDPAGAVGHLRLESTDSPTGELALPEFFNALHQRSPLSRDVAPGLRLTLTWR
ncbi:MAG TPA: hypothetical protein VNR00_09000 [Opitutus sp.]|nr:hypothetical protein [Opitutus sp.]